MELVKEPLAAADSSKESTPRKPMSGASRKGLAPPVPEHGNSTSPAVTTSSAAAPSQVKRPCAEHNFLTDVADVRQMEKGLLLLLEDFHNGKLQVFGKGCTFEQMDQVREQQEKLSRLHFDLDAQQQIPSITDDNAKNIAFKNLTTLVEGLNELSNSVHNLKCSTIHPKAKPAQSPKEKVKLSHSNPPDGD